MTVSAPHRSDRLAVWCGWVLTGAAALTPLLAWLGPLGFAPLVALVGLLCLPAVRLEARNVPLAVVLGLAVLWAALSALWSPFHPKAVGQGTAVKLLLQLPLYWAAWCGARAADPAGRARTARVFAWGLAGYGALLLVEALTRGGVYLNLRTLIGDPIRPDLGWKNIAQGTFALALVWPVAAVAGWRGGAPGWLAVIMAVGCALAAKVFDADAPVLATGLVLAVGGLVMVWPRTAPRLMGLGVGLLILLMPVLVLALKTSHLHLALPLSWSQRVEYWTYAMVRIADHPFRGWGLDASRTFSPHIQLHPHNGPLQVWLELGVIGAAAAALLWIGLFRRLARDDRSLAEAATAGSAAVYVLFGCVSFGVWQEWWLALGALAAVIAATAKPIDARGSSE